MKNGNHCKVSYACFGLLNSLPISNWVIGRSYYPDEASYNTSRSFASETTPNNLSFIQYFPSNNFMGAYWSCPEGKPTREYISAYPDEPAKDMDNRAMKEYFKEMQLLIDDLPIFKGMITIHPLAKVIRVHIKDHPADKVALALFLVRNLAQYDYIHGYRWLRHRGYRPRIAAIITHALQFSPKANAFGEDRWYGRCQDESSWVNPVTFGKNGFLKLIKQEVEWYQDPFCETETGYWRDDAFQDDDDVFNSSADSYEEDSGYYRSLNDVFSVQEDDTFHTSHRSGGSGFYWNNVPANPVEDIFDALIEQSGVSKSL